jgi:hypothetical protein
MVCVDFPFHGLLVLFGFARDVLIPRAPLDGFHPEVVEIGAQGVDGLFKRDLECHFAVAGS